MICHPQVSHHTPPEERTIRLEMGFSAAGSASPADGNFLANSFTIFTNHVGNAPGLNRFGLKHERVTSPRVGDECLPVVDGSCLAFSGFVCRKGGARSL